MNIYTIIFTWVESSSFSDWVRLCGFSVGFFFMLVEGRVHETRDGPWGSYSWYFSPVVKLYVFMFYFQNIKLNSPWHKKKKKKEEEIPSSACSTLFLPWRPVSTHPSWSLSGRSSLAATWTPGLTPLLACWVRQRSTRLAVMSFLSRWQGKYLMFWSVRGRAESPWQIKRKGQYSSRLK